MKTRTVVGFVSATGFERSAGDVVAEHHGGNKFFAGNRAPGKFECSDGCRYNHCAGMVTSACVVKFKSMRGSAVDEGGIERGHFFAAPPKRSGAAAFPSGMKRLREDRRFRCNGAGRAGSDGIEDVADGLLRDGFREILKGCTNDEARQFGAFGLISGNEFFLTHGGSFGWCGLCAN